MTDVYTYCLVIDWRALISLLIHIKRDVDNSIFFFFKCLSLAPFFRMLPSSGDPSNLIKGFSFFLFKNRRQPKLHYWWTMYFAAKYLSGIVTISDQKKEILKTCSVCGSNFQWHQRQTCKGLFALVIR